VNTSRRTFTGLSSGTSLLALTLAMGFAGSAHAQQNAATANASDLEEVVVTGSRLTTGFETATPVTAITTEALVQAAPVNLADSLKQLPALATSASANQTGSGTGASGSNSQNLLNLRNLGTNRNLVLLNGRRTVASNQNNSVDFNILPQNLVSRVDVVTGGASAAYGSDAVAGVVNLILDTEFVGFKGDVGAGISTFGDVPNYKASLAWGGSFAGDRLHVIASTQWARQDGTRVNVPNGRDWWDKPWGLISNTTGSGPANLVLPDIRSSLISDGGLISSGPLKGTQFLAGGVPAPFTYGYSTGSTWMSGGDGSWISYNLTGDQRRLANFGHATYDLNDSTQAYFELGFSKSNASDPNQKPINTGAGFGYTIFRDNAFLPASIAARMDAAGVTSFLLGRYMMEYPDVTIRTKTKVFRQAIGLKGDVFQDWNYDVSYSHGRTNQLLAQDNLNIARPTYAAADAVVNPNTGQVVCRSQFWNGNTFVPGGTGLDPGCKPQNLFGPGSVDPTTIPYTIGDSWKRFTLDQHVFTATISGDLGVGFDAGNVSLATGAEYRTEKVRQINDPISSQTIDFTGIRGGPAALNGRLGPFRFANFQPFGGEYNVKEIFAEVGIPLLAGLPMVEKLNSDFAVRYTDYSTSGGVTTWKAGADYQIVPDVRVRATVSRDIRAPNLLELYNSSTFNSQNQFYPSSTNGVATTVIQITSGNPDLVPERALTQTYGVVLTPTFLEGFNLSVDYYDIKIKGGIQTVGSQQTIDNCYLGVPGFCQYVTPVAGTVRVRSPFLNLSEIVNAGIDFEARYNTDLWGGDLTLGVLATRLTAAYTQALGGARIPTLGGDNDPKWRVNLRANYEYENWKLFVQERFIGPKLVSAQRVEGVFVDDNTVDPAFYTDVTVTYGFEAFGSNNEFYFSVNNVTNQEPPKDVGAPSSFVQPGNRTVYDFLGRYFNVGLRFKY
jgi:outer membrane receptor protein involved in Fe transport